MKCETSYDNNEMGPQNKWEKIVSGRQKQNKREGKDKQHEFVQNSKSTK